MKKSQSFFLLITFILILMLFSCKTENSTMTQEDTAKIQDDLTIVGNIFDDIFTNNFSSEIFDDLFKNKKALTEGIEKTFKGEVNGNIVTFFKPTLKINNNKANFKIDLKSKYNNYETNDVKLLNDSYLNIFLNFDMDITDDEKISNGVLKINGNLNYSGKKSGICIVDMSINDFDMSFKKYQIKGYIKINNKKIDATILKSYIDSNNDKDNDSKKT
jgi:hypothetical protein